MNGAVPPLTLYTFMAWAGTLHLFPPLFKHVCTRKNRHNNYGIRYLYFVSTVERISVDETCECNTDAFLFKNTVSSVMNYPFFFNFCTIY
jgi:hypothetical protein